MQVDLVAGTATATNGIQFKLKKVSRYLVVEAGRAIKPPPVPLVYNEDKLIQEENPNDPDYRKALDEHNFAAGVNVVRMCLAFGTKPTFVPEDITPFESDEWSDLVAAFGIIIKPEMPTAVRYAEWLRLVGQLGEEELNELISGVLRYSGLSTEEDVATAEDSFRGDTARPALETGEAPPTSANGHRTKQPVGTGA